MPPSPQSISRLSIPPSGLTGGWNETPKATKGSLSICYGHPAKLALVDEHGSDNTRRVYTLGKTAIIGELLDNHDDGDLG